MLINTLRLSTMFHIGDLAYAAHHSTNCIGIIIHVSFKKDWVTIKWFDNDEDEDLWSQFLQKVNP